MEDMDNHCFLGPKQVNNMGQVHGMTWIGLTIITFPSTHHPTIQVCPFEYSDSLFVDKILIYQRGGMNAAPFSPIKSPNVAIGPEETEKHR